MAAGSVSPPPPSGLCQDHWSCVLCPHTDEIGTTLGGVPEAIRPGELVGYSWAPPVSRCQSSLSDFVPTVSPPPLSLSLPPSPYPPCPRVPPVLADTYIQKLKKSYSDSWSRRKLGSINSELHDVQKIMVTNIEEVLQRGEALSALNTKASNLSTLSKKYQQDANELNSRSRFTKVAVTGICLFMVMLYFWWL
ncbi:vesicle-trafficking protein SEC22b-A-like [Chiloscyllium punctatum]|uniref:vesicle-trafficking protein SEC22b-A-like n=1 Tax=Chiloscyllium punctatum TaxID=137246 RepID=UPI003B6322D3